MTYHCAHGRIASSSHGPCPGPSPLCGRIRADAGRTAAAVRASQHRRRNSSDFTLLRSAALRDGDSQHTDVDECAAAGRFAMVCRPRSHHGRAKCSVTRPRLGTKIDRRRGASRRRSPVLACRQDAGHVDFRSERIPMHAGHTFTRRRALARADQELPRGKHDGACR